MTFMDVMEMKQITTNDLSPDSRMVVFAVSSVDWKSGRAFSDIYVAPTSGAGMRQMTFTRDRNEISPQWSPDSKWIAFLSDRDGATGATGATDRKNQLYIIRVDGGEAQKITDEKEGVDRFEYSRDGRWFAYTSGKQGERQLYIIPFEGGRSIAMTKRESGVNDWSWSPDGRGIYFTSPNSVDKLDRQRIEKKFDVRIVNQGQSARQLWYVDVDSKKEKSITTGNDFTVASFTISRDGKKIAIRAASPNRYATGAETEIYLLDVGSSSLNRITNNGVGEGQIAFSPDSQQIAFSSSEGFTFMRNSQIYVVSVSGGEAKPVVKNFDGDPSGFDWSSDGKDILFSAGMGVNQNLYSVSATGGTPKRLTDITGVAGFSFDEDAEGDIVLINFSDPSTPSNIYAASKKSVSDRASWKKLTDVNSQVSGFELGSYETVRWKSSDGVMVEGILIKPVGYREGQRYPLIVQLHGGPASAVENSFTSGYSYYPHIFAANGYALLQPNYRGSTNYGEKFKMQIAGDYFRQAYDDIITGVDYLINRGLADPAKLGMMGWSAGGHWSNWTLVQTDRFKAISSGAGAVNWISMYAQTDVQLPREFYFKGKPYDNWDHYLAVSPLRYIKNAKTPTLIHVGEADPRVPMPQSVELHMALKKLGVPTELITYPGMPHGLTNPRYQMVKMVSEFGWFEKWIKGKQEWLDWKVMLDTLKEEDAKMSSGQLPASSGQ
jgi:dipeptidyl aminopeptidase/acylaminoacyl peptidase